MSLGFPLSVWSRVFVFFSVSEGGKGNSGLHSTPSNYSSFYGMEPGGGVLSSQKERFSVSIPPGWYLL